MNDSSNQPKEMSYTLQVLNKKLPPKERKHYFSFCKEIVRKKQRGLNGD